MARLPFDIVKLASAGGVYDQVRSAKKKLREKISTTVHAGRASGLASIVVETWQERLVELLHSEIPEWGCLAAYRSIIDFKLDPEKVLFLKGLRVTQPTTVDVKPILSSQDELKTAYQEYFACRDIHSGKFTVVDPVAKELIDGLDRSTAAIGGQAGNILWLLQCINGKPYGYVPYIPKRLQPITEIGEIPFLLFESTGSEWKPFDKLPSVVPGSNEEPPYGASFVIAKNRKRMILQLQGFRVVRPNPKNEPESLPFVEVEYRLDGKALAPPIQIQNAKSWPQMPFFSFIFLEGTKLVIDIAGEARIIKAFHRGDGSLAVQMAVMGGLNAVFYDPWLKETSALRHRLAQLVEMQMRTLRDLGIRIGAELSGKPDRDFYEMLKRLCGNGTIVALGINGEDELPEITNVTKGKDGKDNDPVSYDCYLDPNEIPLEIRSKHLDKNACEFLYITYLRAKVLAEGLGVRTLYVHTNSIDMVLRRGADPGALATAQHAAFVGKGLVLAALMQKSYGATWLDEMPRVPLAVKPESMVQLWCFAELFDKYTAKGSFESLLMNGLWLNPDREGYSVAVLPVIWPALEDQVNMPPELNATGAGDMTLGAVFYLGGL